MSANSLLLPRVDRCHTMSIHLAHTPMEDSTAWSRANAIANLPLCLLAGTACEDDRGFSLVKLKGVQLQDSPRWQCQPGTAADRLCHRRSAYFWRKIAKDAKATDIERELYPEMMSVQRGCIAPPAPCSCSSLRRDAHCSSAPAAPQMPRLAPSTHPRSIRAKPERLARWHAAATMQATTENYTADVPVAGQQVRLFDVNSTGQAVDMILASP